MFHYVSTSLYVLNGSVGLVNDTVLIKNFPPLGCDGVSLLLKKTYLFPIGVLRNRTSSDVA